MKWLFVFLVIVLVPLSGCVTDTEVKEASETFQPAHNNPPDDEPLPDDSHHPVEEFIDDVFGGPSYPDCEGKEFTVAFIDLDQVEEITPLGNLNPPEHTFPTEHTYLHLSSLGATLRAPADITITSLSSSTNTEQGTTDYAMNFFLCEDIEGYFIHIKTLAPELEALLTQDQCNSYGGDSGQKYQHCWTDPQHAMNAGEVIGTVGNENQGNFDFGVRDYRTSLAYANPNRYGQSSLVIACPYDYYEQDLADSFKNKLARDQSPTCGEVEQDEPGTLQGNWFHNDAVQITDWFAHLAFVHDNHDPSLAVISIGGVFTKANRWIFTPTSSGFANRAFADVIPDNKIYCYDQGQEGRILVQLTSETSLQIEHQNGDCTPSVTFSDPTTYHR